MAILSKETVVEPNLIIVSRLGLNKILMFALFISFAEKCSFIFFFFFLVAELPEAYLPRLQVVEL